jgi:glutathione-regulated potassium-efflux system protein KefB
MDFGHAGALFAAGVFAVPPLRKLGLGAVLGYLAAGVSVGPFGLNLFDDPEAIIHVAELGMVTFLFLIGLEMRPAKLWAMRRDIFGLGVVQVMACGALLLGVGIAYGLPPAAAVIGAMGFVVSSIAVIMKMMDDRGDTAFPSGQRSVAILQREDLAFPQLALVGLLATLSPAVAAVQVTQPWRQAPLVAVGAAAVVFAEGKWPMNPMFSVLAASGAREVMTAAALLVVLGAAVFMDWAGLSMGVVAFLAAALLSGSTFSYQLEVDVEPFRSILLGLFFLGAGMSLDLLLVWNQLQVIIGGVRVFMLVKSIIIYTVAHTFRVKHREALRRAVLSAVGASLRSYSIRRPYAPACWKAEPRRA